MCKEDYIVFESIGENVEQCSIPLTLESAVNFLLSIRKTYSDRHFYICQRLSQQEIEEAQKHLTVGDNHAEVDRADALQAEIDSIHNKQQMHGIIESDMLEQEISTLHSFFNGNENRFPASCKAWKTIETKLNQLMHDKLV